MALEKALLINTFTGERIPVMFNPEEYSIVKSNNFAEIGIPGLPSPLLQFVRGNIKTLTMKLFFDTYEAARSKDVRQHTNKILKLMDIDPKQQAPPVLLFSWGRLNFRCVLDSVSKEFTMFLDSGTPVRATLNVTFKEFRTLDLQISEIGTAAANLVRQIVEGDTLSAIAGEEYGDPALWRKIAEANNLEDPFTLATGSSLVIPAKE